MQGIETKAYTAIHGIHKIYHATVGEKSLCVTAVHNSIFFTNLVAYIFSFTLDIRI